MKDDLCYAECLGQTPNEILTYSNRTQSGKQFVGFNLYVRRIIIMLIIFANETFIKLYYICVRIQMNFLNFIEHCHKNNLQPAEVLTQEENNVLTSYLDGNFG